jgi:hypothetical protein
MKWEAAAAAAAFYSNKIGFLPACLLAFAFLFFPK